MVSIFYKTLKDKKFKKVSSVKPGCWINVENAESEELEKIAEMTGLQTGDLKDTLDRYELPRVERQEEGLIVYTRYPTDEKAELYTELMAIILTDKYLITISPTKNHIIENLVDQATKIATTQKIKLILKLLLKVAQEYTLKTKQVSNKVPRGKTELNRIDSKDFIVLAQSEEILNQYISALVLMNNSLETAISKKLISVHEEDKDILEDLIIGFKQSADLCDLSIKSIRGIRDSYQVIFTNNLNKIIKILTVMTILLSIPTMIGGLYGMNIALPYQNHPMIFAYLVWITIIIWSIAFVIFYYKKWLQ